MKWNKIIKNIYINNKYENFRKNVLFAWRFILNETILFWLTISNLKPFFKCSWTTVFETNCKVSLSHFFFLNFSIISSNQLCFQGMFWLYNRGDYALLVEEAINTDWDALKYDDINIYASKITNRLLKKSDKHI